MIMVLAIDLTLALLAMLICRSNTWKIDCIHSLTSLMQIGVWVAEP